MAPNAAKTFRELRLAEDSEAYLTVWTFPPSSGPYPWQRVMEIAETIQCPFCGQAFELVIDTSIPTQHFTTDCEVCCRPFEVWAECEPGAVLSVSAG